MRKLLVVADDFTGALDTAVKCAAVGLRTSVVTDGANPIAEDLSEEVLVLPLATRHCSKEAAYQAIFSAVRAFGHDVPLIMKKTDSALRGNIGSELAAALDASGERILAFLPAFPQMGRTTHTGVQYCNGVPVHQSEFGKDPFEPVRRSDVAGIIAEQTQTAVLCLSAEGQPPSGFSGIVVFDGENDGQMQETVARLKDDGHLRLVAGCAGLGGVIADLLCTCKPAAAETIRLGKFFVICGSVNPISERQIAFAVKNGFHEIRLGGGAQDGPTFHQSEAYDSLLKQMCTYAGAEQPLIVASCGWVGGAENAREAEAVNHARVSFAELLSAVAQDLMDRREEDAVVVIGGDTLLALIQRLKLRHIEPKCELAPGVVLFQADYRGRKRTVISKSGGFGDEDLLVKLAEQAALQDKGA